MCVVVLANGKEGICRREMEKERHEFNWRRKDGLKILDSTAFMQMQAGREKHNREEGEELVVQS